MADIGGKAASWVRLREAGLLVPDGFAVAAGATSDDPAVAEHVAALLSRRRVRALAVRSSGVGEDGAETSMAGLFESFLDVPPTLEAVVTAIRRCRAAGESARARSAFGRAVPMGVLVQEMIDPRCSGVLFTRDPMGGDGMVVEAVAGHLGRLVGGAADAARWTLCCRTAGTPYPEVDDDELHALGELVERVVGAPADIEWALGPDGLVVLQARPITNLDRDAGRGLTLVAVTANNAPKLPREVRQHDKIALRVVASELGIAISNGFVALASFPSPADVQQAAARLLAWGEFIAVLLVPFDLEGQIFRRFGTGATAEHDIASFANAVGQKHDRFAFLLKELQDTAMTGVAVRLPDGSVHVEIVEGHFVTKGFADPTVYRLGPSGELLAHAPGRQDLAMQVVGGRKVRMPVERPPTATAAQLASVRHATLGLATRYPDAGIEFGFTPMGDFFLVDLYQSAATRPPDRGDVLSEGRVVGRVRVLHLPEDAVEESIERHVHSRGDDAAGARTEAEIVVVRRPLHVLDRLIYEAAPDALGFIVEGGALLCHLAVVMRERGVPGLVLPGALEAFRDGDRIVLDTRPGSGATVVRL